MEVKESKRLTLRRPFERKLYAALRVQVGESRANVGADLRVAESTLRGWIHEETIQKHVQTMNVIYDLMILKWNPMYKEQLQLLDNVFDWYISQNGIGHLDGAQSPFYSMSPTVNGYSRPESSIIYQRRAKSNSCSSCSSDDDSSFSRRRLCSEDDIDQIEPVAQQKRAESNAVAGQKPSSSAGTEVNLTVVTQLVNVNPLSLSVAGELSEKDVSSIEFQ